MRKLILLSFLIHSYLTSFTQPAETFTDIRDGQTYKTVIIGTQTWMAENLNYNAPNSWCYADSISNCTTYGRLYTWEAAKNSCPDGWHLPTNEEWRILEKYLGMSEKEMNIFLYRGEGIGTKLKSKTGFNGIFGGRRMFMDGTFDEKGKIGVWWSSTTEIWEGNTYAFRREIYSDKSGIDWDAATMTMGFSVRCVKN